MNSLIAAMTVFAFVGAVTPGPVNLLATSTAVNLGFRHAVWHVLGASFAYAFVVFVSGSVMHSLLKLLPKMEMLMQIAGTLFLLYLAFKIYATSPGTFSGERSPNGGLVTGSLTQLLNPKAWLYATSGVSIYVIGQENEGLALSAFIVVSLIVCMLGVGVWAALGRVLVNHLENPARQRQFNKGMAFLLFGTVAMIWM
ncbi:LysE family translocator [Parasalinivibrio latis]|uniref:LysE family translocator n=1 Tax=Parasalinivibrio latis TaxID=2952610 RepID=UPI0030E36347